MKILFSLILALAGVSAFAQGLTIRSLNGFGTNTVITNLHSLNGTNTGKFTAQAGTNATILSVDGPAGGSTGFLVVSTNHHVSVGIQVGSITNALEITDAGSVLIQVATLSASGTAGFNFVSYGDNTHSWAPYRNDDGRFILVHSDTVYPAGTLTVPLIFSTTDTMTISGNFEMGAGKTIRIPSGANRRAGNATLVGGTIAVANTTVTADTIVMLTRKSSGGTIGTAITYTLSAGTSFTINSDNPLDTSIFSYLLVESP